MNRKFAVTHGCVFCGTCITICPVNAIDMDENGAHIDAGKCTGCGKCAQDCCGEAIQEIQAVTTQTEQGGK